MPAKLYYSLIIILCLFATVLIATGGFTFQIGVITFSAHRINTSVALIILLTTIQFLSSKDFRRSLIRCLELLVNNGRYFMVFIFSLFLIELFLGFFYHIFSTQILFFDLDKEFSFGTYFSSFLLFGNSLVIAVIYQFERKTQKSNRGWWFIGFVFWYLSLDELARLHEAVIPLLKRHASSSSFEIDSVKTWAVLFLPFILFAIVYFFYFFFNKLKHHPKIFKGLITGMIFWILVIGLELWTEPSTSFAYYKILVEEVSEMIGSTFLLASFIGYFKISKSKTELSSLGVN